MGSEMCIRDRYKNVLALRSYDWMDNGKELAASISLRRHGGLKTE